MQRADDVAVTNDQPLPAAAPDPEPLSGRELAEASPESPGEVAPTADRSAGAEDADATGPATGSPAPAAVDTDGRLEQLLEHAEVISERVAEIVRLQQCHDQIVDRLHDENQRLRAGELAQAQAPLIRDLLRLHDDIAKLEGGDTAAAGQTDLGEVRRSLLGILDRAGVVAFTPDLGEPFDPASHQGIDRIPAEGAAADRTVARTLRCGFRHAGGRILRPAEVDVYQFS